MVRSPSRLVVAAMVVLGASHAFASAKSTVTITIENQTGYYLVAVNRAPEEVSEWGDSILGEGVVVRPSKGRDVAIPAGYAWLRAVFEVDGSEVEIVEQAEFADGGEYVWRISEEMLWEAYGADGGDTYGYYDDTYGYYGDSYGYYDD